MYRMPSVTMGFRLAPLLPQFAAACDLISAVPRHLTVSGRACVSASLTSS